MVQTMGDKVRVSRKSASGEVATAEWEQIEDGRWMKMMFDKIKSRVLGTVRTGT
jgi:hypothetical protein